MKSAIEIPSGDARTPPPDLIALAEALARAAVAKDIKDARTPKDLSDADRHLRSLQQR